MTRSHAPKRFHSRKMAGVTARPAQKISRNARVIALSVALSLGAAGIGSIAEAKTIKILEADRLELRNVIPPGGGESQELVVITGHPAIIQVDDDELEADRIEYNKTKRTLTIIGNGIYRTKTETVAAQDLTVDLETQGLQGEDVLISTKEIDVIGVSAERVPGQLDVVDGAFSPCARCGRTPNDYGFRAESITLYPGDRLIARNVTVLIADEPVMFMPIVVLLLNDPSRQPRLDFKTDSASGGDGTTLEADLPFVTGDYGIGFTFLRYFEKRTPSFGIGFEWQLYNLFDATNTSKLFFLILPPTPKTADSSTTFSTNKALLAYQLDTKGVIELTPGAEPEDALPSIKFEAQITRADNGIKSEDLRGVTGTDQRTNYKLRLEAETAEYNANLTGNGVLDHRDLSKLPLENQKPEDFGSLEFSIDVRGPALPKFEPFSVTSFGLRLGNIRDRVDTSNESARRTANGSPYISAARFTINYGLAFNQTPWEGANLTASQSFTGRYYSTQNPSDPLNPTQPGEFERNIQTNLNAGFSQTLLEGKLTFGATYNYGIREGESPFFDGGNVGRGRPTETGTLNIGARPFDWLSLSASDSINFRKTEFKWDPALLSANLNTTQANPISGNSSLTYNIERGEPHLWNLGLASSTPSGFSFNVSFGYDFVTTEERRNQINNPNTRPLENRWTDWNSAVGYRTPDSKFNASLGLRLNLNTFEPFAWTFSSAATVGDRDTPVTLSLNETYSPLQNRNNRINDAINTLTPTPVTSPRLDGNFSVNWTGYRFNLNHNFDWRNFEYTASTPTPPSSVNFSLASTASSEQPGNQQNQQGQPIPGEIPEGWNSSWTLQLGSRLDLDPVEFFDSKLNGTFQLSSNPITLTSSGLISLPDRNRRDIELTNFSIDLGWDIFPGIALQGGIAYNRTWTDQSKWFQPRDAFTFTPLSFTIALAGEASSKPDVFLTVELSGTYTFRSETPGTPFYTPASAGLDGFSGLRPKFILTFDRCCWSLQLTFDASKLEGPSFSLSFKLPVGGDKKLITADNNGIKFPALPFIPAITPPAIIPPATKP
jgi:hypothetical protein